MPCHHDGKCIDQLGGFKCDCTGTGYSGVLCQMNIDECASDPCQNEAKCEDQINDYTCSCYPGYTGKLLTSRILFCFVVVVAATFDTISSVPAVEVFKHRKHVIHKWNRTFESG